MSSGFIPMVSTTPPPIDDDEDDFTDFMDGQEEEFGEFSSHAEDGSFSFSPMNSPPHFSNNSKNDDGGSDWLPDHALPKDEECKEVEIILKESERCKKFQAQTDTVSVTKPAKPFQASPNGVDLEPGYFGNDERVLKNSNGLIDSNSEFSEKSFDDNNHQNSKDINGYINSGRPESTDIAMSETQQTEETSNIGLGENETSFDNVDQSSMNEDEVEDKNALEDNELNTQMDCTEENTVSNNGGLKFPPDIMLDSRKSNNLDLFAHEATNPKNGAAVSFDRSSPSGEEFADFGSSSQWETSTSKTTENTVRQTPHADNDSLVTGVLNLASNNKDISQISAVTDEVKSAKNTVEPEISCINTQTETETDIQPNCIVDTNAEDFADFSSHESEVGEKDVVSVDPKTDNSSESPITVESNKSQSEHKIENDFDDFADFASHKTVVAEEDAPHENNHSSGSLDTVTSKEILSDQKFADTEDDFADFASIEPSNGKNASENYENLEASTEGNFESQNDFADFADFSSAPDNTSEDVNASESDKNKFEQTEGFADFSSADTKPVSEDNQVSGSTEFGKFDSENDDDFGDFNSTSDAGFQWAEAPPTVTKILTVSEKVQDFISNYARRKEQHTNEVITQLDKITKPDSDVNSTTESAEIQKSSDLWTQLEDIDNALALKFIWNGSNHNKHLLDSLGMHTQNILFSGDKQAYYVPTYYAAGLGLLDPAKGILKPMSAAEKITAISQSEKNPSVIKDDVVPPSEPYPEWKTVADLHDSNQSTIIEASTSWSASGSGKDNPGSGLTIVANCEPQLSVEVAAPPPMNLDYFENLHGAQGEAKSPDLIDPELLELTTAPTTDPPPPPKDSGSATLSKILASIKGSSTSPVSMPNLSNGAADLKWEEEECKLSSEARGVLQKLPDLSYMRSKVLMFPINMSRVSIDDDA